MKLAFYLLAMAAANAGLCAISAARDEPIWTTVHAVVAVMCLIAAWIERRRP